MRRPPLHLVLDIRPNMWVMQAEIRTSSEQVERAAGFPTAPCWESRRRAIGRPHFPRRNGSVCNAMVALSPRGPQILAEKSGHFVHHDQPDLVVRAISEVIGEVRK